MKLFCKVLLGIFIFAFSGALVLLYASRQSSLVFNGVGAYVEYRDFGLARGLLKSFDCPVVIVRDGCGACARAKEWMNSKGYCFRVVDIASEQGSRVAKSQGFSAVPTVMFLDGFIEGFEEGAWQEGFENEEH